MIDSRTLHLMVIALSVVGCSKKSTNAPGEDKRDVMAKEKILQQAAFDLQCEKGQLQVQKISDDVQMMGTKNATWGVRGCDKQATYKSSCGLGNCQILSEAQAASMGVQ